MKKTALLGTLLLTTPSFANVTQDQIDARYPCLQQETMTYACANSLARDAPSLAIANPVNQIITLAPEETYELTGANVYSFPFSEGIAAYIDVIPLNEEGTFEFGYRDALVRCYNDERLRISRLNVDMQLDIRFEPELSISGSFEYSCEDVFGIKSEPKIFTLEQLSR